MADMQGLFVRSWPAMAMLLAAAGGARSQQAATQTQRVPQFENAKVKVWTSTVMPNSPLTLHRHDHPRVIIALQGGIMSIAEENGPSERHVWETGKSYWLPANPPNTRHADVNVGDKPIVVTVVELKNEK